MPNSPMSTRIRAVLFSPLFPISVIAALAPHTAAAQSACYDAAQGKIAWNYDGDKRWSRDNLERLCGDAEDSAQPAQCLDRVMHGGVNWGGGTRWQLENALTLCRGSRNAAARVSCFTDRIQAGSGWSEAIDACRGSGTKSRTAAVAAAPASAVTEAAGGRNLATAPAARAAGAGSRLPLDLGSEAVRRAVGEQTTRSGQRREPDTRCSQVPLERGRIQLDRAIAGGNIIRLEGCLGEPDTDDVEVWLRQGSRVDKRRAGFHRTYATVDRREAEYWEGAEATLVRTRGDETFQLTPWVALEQAEGDKDGDGHEALEWGGDDCDDSDSNRYPGNAEVADASHDEDCDPSTIDSGTRLHAASGDGDRDNDTFIDENVGNYFESRSVAESANYHIIERDGRDFVYGTDCDDSRPDVHPQQIEVCNARDDNCDGNVDEDLLNCPN